MLKLKKNSTLWIVMLSFVSFSCNKNESDSNSTTSSLVIQSVAIEQEDEPIVINQNEPLSSSSIGSKEASTFNSMQRNGTRESDTAAVSGDMVYGSEFDALIEMEGHNLNSQVDSSSSKLAAAKRINKIAADVPIASTMKFRLLIYVSGNQSTPIANLALGRGDAPNIQLNGGTTYTWYAVSTNEAVAPNVSTAGVVSSSDLQNKDFMFATGTLKLATGPNYLQIIFKRQMTAIEVDVNTRGLFGPMLNTSSISIGQGSGATFSPLIRTGNFNIFNSSFTDFTNISPVISASAMRVVDTRWGNAEKIATFYSAENSTNSRNIPANQLKVRLNTLSITLDDNTTRTFTNNTTLTIPHSATLALAKGKRSRANVRLVESAVLVGGLRWARTNLLYEPSKLYQSAYMTGQSDAYRFRPSNNYTVPTNNEYWNHTTTTPTGTDYFTVNQCGRVFPEGTWETPSYFDVDESYHFPLLIAAPHFARRRTISGSTQYSIVWTLDASQVNNIYPDPTELILPLFGYRNSSGAFVGRVTSSTSSAQLHYWSMAGVRGETNGFYLYAVGNSGSPASISSFSQRTAPFTQGRSVRCIRAVN